MDFKELPSSRAASRGETVHPDPLRAPTMWATTGFEGDGLGEAEDAGGAGAPGAVTASTFDVCHVGVVLRVVLGVQALLWLGALHGSTGLLDWLNRWSSAAAVGLPASLAWLVVICGVRRWLGRSGNAVQWGVAMLVGALAGGYGHAQFALMEWWVGPRGLSPWALAGPMATGAGLAAICLAWLRQRQRGAVPEQNRARLVELQARIRPHFLFNTINTAIALVQIDPQRAESVLEDLAELFRRALASPSTQATLAEEVDLAQRYLRIEQLRFGERLSVRWEIEEDTGEALVPTLLLQPLVENAVKHGVEADPRGGWVRVSTRRKGQRVVVSVSNSLPPSGTPAGGSSRRGHGIALRNVRQRLMLMHDVEAEFEAGARPLSPGAAEQCFVVAISLPGPRGS